MWNALISLLSTFYLISSGLVCVHFGSFHITFLFTIWLQKMYELLGTILGNHHSDKTMQFAWMPFKYRRWLLALSPVSFLFLITDGQLSEMHAGYLIIWMPVNVILGYVHTHWAIYITRQASFPMGWDRSSLSWRQWQPNVKPFFPLLLHIFGIQLILFWLFTYFFVFGGCSIRCGEGVMGLWIGLVGIRSCDFETVNRMVRSVSAG